MTPERGTAGAGTEVDVEGTRLSLTRVDKVLFPRTGTTKGDVLSYYSRIAPHLLPHLARRPVTLVRAPDGVEGGTFFEKRLPRGAPPWMKSITVQGSGGAAPIGYPAVSTVAQLLWLANMAAIEFHVPQWRLGARGSPLRPDLVVFDLDPGSPATVVECGVVALELRGLLRDDGIDAVVKTSGSKGLQLYARRGGRSGRTDNLDYAREVARRMEREHPADIVSNMRKDRRQGRVLIDWSQNHPAKTTVAPYSVRLREVPSVSTPVTWDEVRSVAGGGDPDRLRFLLDDVIARVDRFGDLFEPLLRRGGAAKSAAPS